MKTYLTDEEFADLFFKELKNAIVCHPGSIAATDRIVWTLFQEFEKDVKETLIDSMYNIDEYTGEKAIDLIGYQFHKSFRQVDPINARFINGIIWQCLQEAPVFWKTLKKCCIALQNADSAEIYLDHEEAV